MPRRVSRREAIGQGAGSLISGLLYREEFFRDVAASRRSQGGIQRISGSPDFTEYGGPGGLHSPYMNLITVAKDGGDFRWITDALDYIQDNDVVNPYTILVYPGVYDEQVVMKEYVALVGLDRDVCIIKSSDYQILVTMASHSSLNEIQVIQEGDYAVFVRAVVAQSETDFLIDSCILRAEGTTGGTVTTLYTNGCGDFRVVGSELYAQNHEQMGVVQVVQVQAFGSVVGIEFGYCHFEIEPTTPASGRVMYITAAASTSIITRIIGSRFIADNTVGLQRGLFVHSIDGECIAKVVASSFEHRSAAGGGADLVTDGDDGWIFVRAVEYSDWGMTSQIIPLAGDRPRLERVAQSTAFIPAAAAGVWENTNCTDTIDLPCESDLKVEVTIVWDSDTVDNRVADFQMDLDGASQDGGIGYVGTSTVNCRENAKVIAYFNNVATGVHTLTVQIRRRNAAWAVTLRQQNMATLSVPWP